MVKKIVVLLISVLLSIHCGKNQNNGVDSIELTDSNKVVPLKFELVKSVRIDNLAYPEFYINKNEVGVYGYSIKENNGVGVYRFDHEFNPKGKIYFPFGQGPGDAGAATRFHSMKGKIMSYDHTTKIFSYYDENLKFLKMQRKLKPTTPFYFFRDGEYCVSIGDIEKGNKAYSNINITKFPSFERKPIHQYGPTIICDQKRIIAREPGGDYFYSEKTGWVYVLNMAEYRIMAFDLNGKMVKQIKVKTKKIKISHEEQFKYIEDYLTNWGVRNHYKFCEIVQPASLMVPFEKGFVVIRRIDWRRHNESGFADGDLFDYHLNLLGKVKIPEFYRCYYIHTMIPSPHTSCYFNGYFYLVKETDEDYILEKWKVTE